jgi:hypothetical protein
VNILDVAKRTVLAYPGSYAGMAAAMGVSANVLRNKLSRTNDTHHLSLLEAREICEHAADATVPDPYALLRCLAADFGFQLVKEGHGAGAGDLSIAEQLLRAQRRNHELYLSVIKALDDGVIEPHELADIVDKRRAAGQANAEIEEMARQFSGLPKGEA